MEECVLLWNTPIEMHKASSYVLFLVYQVTSTAKHISLKIKNAQCYSATSKVFSY